MFNISSAMNVASFQKTEVQKHSESGGFEWSNVCFLIYVLYFQTQLISADKNCHSCVFMITWELWTQMPNHVMLLSLWKIRLYLRKWLDTGNVCVLEVWHFILLPVSFTEFPVKAETWSKSYCGLFSSWTFMFFYPRFPNKYFGTDE